MSDRRPDGALLAATAALLLAACLPLARAYHGLAFFRPVLAALLLALALLWGARRLGAGPLAGLGVSVAGWALFTGLVFLPDTLRLGVLPTGETLSAGYELWLRGIALIQARPAPVFAEAPLLLITITGLWAVVHVVDGLVFWLRAPVKAVAMAAVLWLTPLAVTPGAHSAWPWAVPFLAAAAVLLLVAGVADLNRWGRHTGDEAELTLGRIAPRGVVLGVAAIAAGALFAGALPGFGEQPWYRLRSPGGGTTVTDNPIVTIRASLVSQSQEPLLRVRTAQPVYLRTTSLDVYSAGEEWTNSGIRGGAVTGPVPFERPIARARDIEVEVEVENLPGAILVPAPYQVSELGGPASASFHYDPRLSTVTLGRGASLEAGDRYTVVSAIPAPDPESAPAEVLHDPRDPLTALPDDIPASVTALARDIVAAAGAATPFEQALAIQEELRSWTYSLEPPQGHSGRAMEAFVTNRIGYCEQFAGTMAVMLRSLGIPARVAVGFTPGELVSIDAGIDTGSQAIDPATGAALPVAEYLVTNRNAHAWVEVLTARHGWLAFEPTPRDDGNVIVPTALNLAPTATVAQEAEAVTPDIPGAPPDDADFLPPPGEEVGDDVAQQPGAGEEGERGAGWGAVAVVLLLVIGVAVAVARQRQRQDVERVPAERILEARRRTERTARGLGLRPRPSETDTEYLSRVAARTAANGQVGAAASLLAAETTCVRYAPFMPEDGAEEAEEAARVLINGLVGDLSSPRRLWVEVRGYSSRWSPR
jgi:transglutaminase-like putative cysteine protease